MGAMAHSRVQLFDSEYEAFKKYAAIYPGGCTLLVDTYSVLKSGITNTIKCFDEALKPMGYPPKGVRIDSGDISYLTKRGWMPPDTPTARSWLPTPWTST